MERVQCPHCKRTVTFKSLSERPYFPFCSERCKMADLGMWFREEHRVPGPPDEPRDGAKPAKPSGPQPKQPHS